MAFSVQLLSILTRFLPVALLGGCMFNTDSNPNDRIIVENRTDQTLTLGLFSCSESGVVTHDFETLEAGRKSEYYVCGGMGAYDYVEVIMGDRKKRYPLDGDLWGTEEIEVNESDFPG